MSQIFVYLMYMAAGIIIDIFYTIWYAAISDKNIPAAMIGSFVVTMAGYTLVYNLVLGPGFLANLVSYAIGCSIGTALPLWYKNKRTILKQPKGDL